MRARNIKPGFFQSGQVAKCEPLARILFAGLWCVADREGRLKDDSFDLKIKLLPADNCDVNILLQQLHDIGLIIRYQVDGNSYIQINEFTKHQKPHVKESNSSIPSIDNKRKIKKKPAPTQKRPAPTQTGLARENFPSSLIADSLIPSSLIPESFPTGKTRDALPDWLPKPEWESFVEMRKKIRAPLTDRAVLLAVGKLEKFRAMGHDPAEILNKSVLNDWRDLYEPKENKNANIGRNTGQKPTFKSAGADLSAKYLADAEREEQGGIINAALPDLRSAEAIRQNPGRAGGSG